MAGPCNRASICVLSLLLVASLSPAAGANVIAWGGGTGNWNVGGNWTGGMLPTTGDTAVIASGTPSINATLSPAPDVIRVDAGGTARFTASNANNWVLNGGAFNMAGDSNPNVSGSILLTANSTIMNTRGNSNRSFTISGSISEDATPRKVTFDGAPHISGTPGDTVSLGGASTYSGGTDIYGPTVSANSSGALGTGPVTVYSGTCRLNLSGSYTCGPISTVAGGTGVVSVYGGKNPTNLQLNLQGGALTHTGSSGGSTLSNTNSITISNSVEIKSMGGYMNNVLNIGAAIGGTGKAVLEDWGTPTWTGTAWSTPNVSHLVISGTQNWSGGTDVKGLVDLVSGGFLPGGTINVYGVDNSKLYGGSGKGELRLLNSAAGANGGLSAGTDLVLTDMVYTSGVNSLVCYASLNLGQNVTNVTVNSLMINGVYVQPGVYHAADAEMANRLYTYNAAYTLTVVAPEPATLTLLALAGLALAARRRR